MSNFVRLPEDVDGVPIRRGDKVELLHNHHVRTVGMLEYVGAKDMTWRMWPEDGGGGWGDYTPCRHVASETLSQESDGERESGDLSSRVSRIIATVKAEAEGLDANEQAMVYLLASKLMEGRVNAVISRMYSPKTGRGGGRHDA